MAFDETWNAMGTDERIVFSLDWEADHAEGWAQVRQIGSTSKVLEILEEIALHLANVEAHRDNGVTPSEIDSTLPEAHSRLHAWYDRVVAVAAQDPRHAGGWWGSLSIDYARGAYTYSHRGSSRVPGGDTALTVFRILATSTRPRPDATERQNNERILTFVNAQREAGGLEHLGTTLMALVHDSDDWDLLDRYLIGLRGHHADEAGGRHHHLRDMIRTGGSVDTNTPLRRAMGALSTFLLRSPQINAGSPSGHWRTTVEDCLDLWSDAMGDHRDGLTWLKSRLETHRDEWADDDQASRVLGVRTTELQVTRGVSTQLTEMQSEIQRALRQLSAAESEGATVSRTEALEQVQTQVESWKNQFQVGTSSSLTANQQSETGASGDVDADIIVAGATVELSQTITLGLEEKIETAMQATRETGGSTSTSESHSESRTEAMTYQAVITELRALERSVSRTLSVTRTRREAVTHVIAADEDGRSLIAATERAIGDQLAVIEAALR